MADNKKKTKKVPSETLRREKKAWANKNAKGYDNRI